MIQFQTLTIEGFGSIIDKMVYFFDDKGIKIIFGKNGSGKSTILNALNWVIYKKPIKSNALITPYEDLIDKNFKGTIIRLNFKVDNIQYTLIRCKDYKEIVPETKEKGNSNVWLIGDKHTKVRDKEDTQRLIEKVIGYSPRVFKNSILFGQKLTRIINETGPEKKKVFEEAFEVSFIEDLKNKTAKALEGLNKTLQFLEKEISPLKFDIEIKRGKISNLKENKINFENLKKEKINSTQAYYDEVYFEIDEIKKTTEEFRKSKKANQLDTLKLGLEKINKLLGNYSSLRDEEFKQKLKVESVGGELDSYISDKKRLTLKWGNIITECPRCNQALDKKKVKEEKNRIQIEIKEKVKKIEKFQELYTKENKVLETLSNDLSSFNSLIEQRNHLEVNIKTLEKEKIENIKKISSLESLRKELGKYIKEIVKENNKNFDSSGIKKLIQEIKLLKPKYLNIKKEISKIKKEIELHQWAINDPLSNKGIKAYIFDTQLVLVNKELEKYQRVLGFRIKFSIDLGSANKNFEASIYQGKHTRPYDNLSGGEQQLVDIAIAFSIHDVIQGPKPINVLFLDEVFEALDEDNISIVQDLLKEKAYEKSIHLITHNKNFLNSSYSGIHLKLKNKRTQASEY